MKESNSRSSLAVPVSVGRGGVKGKRTLRPNLDSREIRMSLENSLGAFLIKKILANSWYGRVFR